MGGGKRAPPTMAAARSCLASRPCAVPAHAVHARTLLSCLPLLCCAVLCCAVQGVVPSDQMHDMLISMCTKEQLLEEAVDLVKRLARRQPGSPAAAGAAAAAATAAAAAAGGSSGSPPGSPRAAGLAGAVASSLQGGLQEHTMNSLVRALCGKYVDRALRPAEPLPGCAHGVLPALPAAAGGMAGLLRLL